MKASILTLSQTGNTLKVANAIAAALGRNGIELDHVSFLRRKRWNPRSADIVGVGCPVFENRPAEVIPEFLTTAGIDLTGKKAFVFITSGGSPARSLWHLAEAVRQRGATIVGGIQVRGASAFPTLSGLFPGRPDAQDRGRAEAFGHAVAVHLLRDEPLGSEHLVDSRRGRGFYDALGPIMLWLKKKTPIPTTDPSRCDLCGTCVAECPSGSIRIKEKKIEFQETCIRCYRCWQICPPMAIEMKFSPGKGAVERRIYSEWMERRFGDVQLGENMGINRFREVLARKVRVRFDPESRSPELFPSEMYSRRRD